jgi:fermentation-respiration switch protein FrsA (DUF1100 family)
MTLDWPSLLPFAWRLARGTLIGLAILWLCALALLWIFQRNLLYMAPRTPAGPPPAGYAAVKIQTADGLRLTAWYRPAAPGHPTIVLFSAQGASLTWSAEWSEGFAESGMGLLLVSFRGFDGNPGAPSEQGLYSDGRAALAWLAAHGVAKPVLVGVSLGTGVAAEMAAEATARPAIWPGAVEPKALVLLSPYESIPDMAAMRYPIFPVRLLAKDRFDTEAKMSALRLPVLVVHGEMDELIPFSQGLAVYNKAAAPKQFVALSDAGHNYPSQAIVAQVERFLAGLSD